MRHRRDAAGRVTSSLVAIVSVVVIAAAMVAFMVNGSGDTTEVAADQQTAAPSPSKSGASTPAAEPSDANPAATKDDADKKQPKATKKKDKPEPTPAPEPAVPEVYVEVYNMTSVSGLAGSTAAQLQDAGWQVVGIDNWRGNIPASTVYYPSGLADEADQLANTLGIGRVRGAVDPMKFDRLTVILTADAT